MLVKSIITFLTVMVLQVTLACAQSCTFSNTGINFGNVNLTANANPTSTGTFSANCSGTPGQTIRICPNFGDGSGGSAAFGFIRYMTQGANTLAFTLYSNNNVGSVWGSYLWGQGQTPPAMSVALNSSGSASVSQTIYALIYNGQGATSTGTFLSSFSGTQAMVDYGYASNFTCGAALSGRATPVPFIVRTTNQSTCSLTTTDLDFGTQSDLSTVKDATNTIYITCTTGTAYNVSMSNGSSGATNPAARKMTNAQTASGVTYGIYLDANRSQAWGNGTVGGVAAATGNGTAQAFTGYGRLPAQSQPPALDYTDTVVVTLTY